MLQYPLFHICPVYIKTQRRHSVRTNPPPQPDKNVIGSSLKKSSKSRPGEHDEYTKTFNIMLVLILISPVY